MLRPQQEPNQSHLLPCQPSKKRQSNGLIYQIKLNTKNVSFTFHAEALFSMSHLLTAFWWLSGAHLTERSKGDPSLQMRLQPFVLISSMCVILVHWWSYLLSFLVKDRWHGKDGRTFIECSSKAFPVLIELTWDLLDLRWGVVTSLHQAARHRHDPVDVDIGVLGKKTTL